MKRTARGYFFAVLAVFMFGVVGFAFEPTREPVAPDGTRAVIDVPADQHMMNVGGSDGYGLCVPTSITVAAKWQNVSDYFGYRKFCEARPGGSYPEKTEADIRAYASRYKVAVPNYVQHTGGDEAFLDLLIRTRRAPAMTYAGHDDFYNSTIAHMVNGAHVDKTRGAIIDNNRPGTWLWMERDQLINRWKGLDDRGKPLLVPMRRGFRVFWSPVGGGWCFAWLAPPPPPTALPALAPTPKQKTPDGVIPPDAEPADPAKGEWNGGIVIDRVPACCRYWVNGVECSRVKAFAFAGDEGLKDDSDKYHLSIVEAQDRHAEVLALFAPGGKLEPYARRLHVQVYAPDSWVVKTRLKSAVTLQEPAKLGGRVIASKDSATAEGLKKTLGDVFDPPEQPRPEPKPDPNPAPQPDEPAPQPKPPAPVPEIPGWLKSAIAAILAWLGVRSVTK
jgi:hypothetical protein